MLNDDLKGFTEFIKDTFPAMQVKGDFMIEVLFHKGRVNRASIPQALQAQSAAWLQTKGLTPLMPEAKPEGWKEENRK